MDPEVKIFEGLKIEDETSILREYGKFEYPIRYIVGGIGEDWKIYDTRSGKFLQTAGEQGDTDVLRVLDGEHFLTGEGVYSIPLRKKIQDIDDIKAFFGGGNVYRSNFVSLPTPERYDYTVSRYGGSGVAPFDPNHVSQKLVAFKEESDKIGIWSWNTDAESKQVKIKSKLEKEYEAKFEGPVHHIMPLDGWKIVVFLVDSFLIYDISTRETLKKVIDAVTFPSEPFLLPDKRLGRIYVIGRDTHAVDIDGILEKKSGKRVAITLDDVINHTVAKIPEQKAPYEFLVSEIPGGYRFVIVPRGEGLEIEPVGSISRGSVTVITTTGRPENQTSHEIKVEKEELAAETFLHGNDILIVSRKRHDVPKKARVVDVVTGKTKQTLTLSGVDWAIPAIKLPGNLYVLNEDYYSQLLKWEPGIGKSGQGVYKAGRRFVAPGYATFIPTSQVVKKALREKLDGMLRNAVPKEVSDIIAKFI